jgi:hypothetical protein
MRRGMGLVQGTLGDERYADRYHGIVDAFRHGGD